MKMTRDQAIDQLVTDGIFDYEDIGNPAMEYYIKYTMEGEYVFDVDRSAWLNTLFGYDIGYKNAREIDSYMYERDEEVCEHSESSVFSSVEDDIFCCSTIFHETSSHIRDNAVEFSG